MTLRRPSPLGGRKPLKTDLDLSENDNSTAVDDVLPPGWQEGLAPQLELLLIGVNPGLWTAAVNAPFARPGNRFWPSLHRAGLTDHQIDASRGLNPADEQHLYDQGLGITNLVGRATVRADQLTREELWAGAERTTELVTRLQPKRAAVLGITAYRTAFRKPKAVLGRQDTTELAGWPDQVPLWVLPQPSGLNAHENIESLAGHYRAIFAN